MPDFIFFAFMGDVGLVECIIYMLSHNDRSHENQILDQRPWFSPFPISYHTFISYTLPGGKCGPKVPLPRKLYQVFC